MQRVDTLVNGDTLLMKYGNHLQKTKHTATQWGDDNTLNKFTA